MPLKKYKKSEVTGPRINASKPNINKSFIGQSIPQNNIAKSGK